jgi:FMN-dependent NADH-azoreductase
MITETKYLSDMAKFFGIARFDHNSADGLDWGWSADRDCRPAVDRAIELQKTF